MYIAKRGSHRATVTLLVTHVAFGGIRFATCHATVLHPVARYFAARCSTCVKTVAKYVNVESGVEKVMQIPKCYKITASTLSR